MSDAPSAPVAPLRWDGAALRPFEDRVEPPLLVADSWLVDDGRVLALDLHRARFGAAAGDVDGVEAFWHACLAAIPREGAWFPRVELAETGVDVRIARDPHIYSGLADADADAGAGTGARVVPELRFRLRAAPERNRSVRLVTADGDPRRHPGVKGADFPAQDRLRAAARVRGAEESVILSPDGHIVEGAYSALLWWRGDALHHPPSELTRVPSVTARSVLGLAAALGVEVREEAAAPADLEGCEVWAASALHGPRIVIGWVDGPLTAEEPGRLGLWRRRLGRLARPLATLGA